MRTTFSYNHGSVFLVCGSFYRDAVVLLLDAQLQSAVQEDVPGGPSELEHVEGEEAGGSLPVSLHLHRLVSGVPTPAHKQETVSPGVHWTDPDKRLSVRPTRW